MANADQMGLYYIREDPFGVTPTAELLAKTTVSADTSDDSYNDTVEDLSVFTVDQQILVSGFTEADNNGYKTVVSSTIDKLIVVENLATETLGDTVSIKSAMKTLNYTSESLKQETDTQESNTIRDDRQVKEVKRTSIRGAGDINCELEYGNTDDFKEGALMSAGYSSPVSNTDTTYSMASGDNSINDSGNAFVSDGFLANQWYEIRGFIGDTSNNGYYKAVSVVAGKMVLTGKIVVDDSSGESVTITMGAQMTNGVVGHSYSFEKEFSDLSSEFAILTGDEVNSWTVDTDAEGIITETFSFMGKDEASATSSAVTGAASAATNNPAFSAVDDTEAILENYTSTTVKSISFTITNNLRNRPVVGTLGPNSIAPGKISGTGTVDMYFATKAIMDKYLNFTTSSIALVLEDGDANVYIFDFPEIIYTDGVRVSGGRDTDIIAAMTFGIFRDAGEDVTVRITKFDA